MVTPIEISQVLPKCKTVPHRAIANPRASDSLAPWPSLTPVKSAACRRFSQPDAGFQPRLIDPGEKVVVLRVQTLPAGGAEQVVPR